MTHTRFRLLVALALALLVARPASAANKEHQQLMADLRMLQEQSQLLQNMIGTLTDALKTVNTRLDQQAEANRRAVADEKLLIETLTKDLNVVREKVDDNNVRVGSLSQEVDALRQLVQQALARPATSDLGSPVPAPGAATPPTPASSPASGASPARTFDQARGDYAAGLWDLAIDGFEAFLRDFSRTTQAPDAQFYIGSAYLNDGKYDKAIEAFDKVTRLYATSARVPDSYYQKGVALRSLKQLDRAREAWETVTKNYPDGSAAGLARQRLQELASSKP
jgi:tol-pal system protein YbgF